MEIGLTQIIDELLPLLRQFCQGEYGIALGGAHAKGVADGESDLDIYLFADSSISAEERTRLLGQYAANVGEIYSWEIDGEFSQAGTDFTYRDQRVECWLRSSSYIAQTIADCHAGIVIRDLVTWTVMGFFNHCILSDLRNMVPIEDRNGILARWQSQVSVYPPKLRRAIITEHLNAAKFWPDNFHYESAVRRGDIIYVMGIVQQVVSNLIQVVFALNQEYFPGEKKLVTALNRLSLKPDRFAERVEALVFPGDDVGKSSLVEQHQELQALTKEVESLVAKIDSDRVNT